ncbi:SGNH/GDSL hydrolase family protein [Pseudalkalibacillus sp. R45]|uniref:SGNH/GDSL hydrolase family protein n=1 Tax=Pseudalkalibacillus sp. R45 TaxID=3457433 RepID=UPI003FCEDD32
MLKLVCFGDSITARNEGYAKPILATKLSSILKDFEIINSGVAGDNTFDALKRIEKDVVNHNPDLATILFGANDAAFHKMIDLETFENNMIKLVHSISPEKTILISPSPVDEEKQDARNNKTLREYALIVKKVAESNGCYFIDLFTEMLARDHFQEILKGLENDGLHFGEKGYDILADLIINKIEEIKFRGGR